MQAVTIASFEALDFLTPEPSVKAYEAFCDIYHRFLIPAAPYIFGHMVMFHLGKGTEEWSTDSGYGGSRKESNRDDVTGKETVNHPNESCENEIHEGLQSNLTKLKDFEKVVGRLYDDTCATRYGDVSDTLCQLTILLKENIHITKDSVHFKNNQIKKLYEELSAKKMLKVESGKKKSTHMIPIGLKTGYLSETEKEAAIKVNASFFIMDRFDLASVYDCVGTPIGLMVKNGEIINPPLYKREALLVRGDGSVEICVPSLEALGIVIGDRTYCHAENCLIYTRPSYKKTPVPIKADAIDLVIIGKKIRAVHRVFAKKSAYKNQAHNRTDIPASGFVLRVFKDKENDRRKVDLEELNGHKSISKNQSDEDTIKDLKDHQFEFTKNEFKPGEEVAYTGLENVIFGLQVGNSILKNGAETKTFISPFYNIKRPWQTPFPPSLYPLDFEGARAARIALGADTEGKPVLLWAEGAGKVAYEKGKDSRGATLAEMGRYCLDAGMVHAIGLDGGGSAQILLYNERKLKISDRGTKDNTELERAVPCGLIAR